MIMSGKTLPQGASLNQGACGVNNGIAVRPIVQIIAIAARYSPRFYLLRHSAPQGIF